MPTHAITADCQFLWQGFTDAVHDELLLRGYAPTTARTYTAALRHLGRTTMRPPSQLKPDELATYLGKRAYMHAAASTTTTIAALRVTLDEVAGLHLTQGIRTPKRRYYLPYIPSPDQIRALLAAPDTLREQVALGLLYGTGTKPNELVRLRWCDIDLAENLITLPGDRQLAPRRVAIPNALLPVLTEGLRLCPAHHYLFPGRDGMRPLTTRSVETIVRRAADRADLPRYEMTALALRHAFAVHALQQGCNVRQVQCALGLKHVRNVLRYLRCNIPAEIVSPADTLPAADDALAPLAGPAAFRLPFINPDAAPDPRSLLSNFYNLIKRSAKALLAPCRPPG